MRPAFINTILTVVVLVFSPTALTAAICAGVGDVSGEVTGKNRACVSSLHPQQPAWTQLTQIFFLFLFFIPQF